MINCYVIGELSTVESLCAYISNYPVTELRGYSVHIPEHFDPVYHIRPDIVFIDSSLSAGNESWVDRIRQFSSVVLIAGDTHQAFEAFEYLAFDYMIKPVSLNRFVKCINKFELITQLAGSILASRKPEAMESFFIKTDSKGFKEVLIKCDQLIYIQALQNYVVLHMENDRRFSCHNSMKEMEDNLSGSSFSRIHKSFIINDSKITSIEGNTVTLNHAEEHKLLIGNTYRKAFFDKKNERMIKKVKQPNLLSFSRPASLVFCLGFLFGDILDASELLTFLLT
ncbi:response regulator transcription factor [Pedobacter frigidisoli]|uniref:Response regulator transcription factor n=1 Tax=Pedobacter frigidisoli TaxID=2530455 RepID=A0A4R0NWN4_9SPHI|nr:LytTR family DNA-binding domain-containing protein [Pedobacter frigidisoli]TCD05846.1 response regulator transcription factor [Pedobacter frigidisoli]